MAKNLQKSGEGVARTHTTVAGPTNSRHVPWQPHHEVPEWHPGADHTASPLSQLTGMTQIAHQTSWTQRRVRGARSLWGV